MENKKRKYDKYIAVLEKEHVARWMIDELFERYEMSVPEFLATVDEMKKEGLRRYRL